MDQGSALPFSFFLSLNASYDAGEQPVDAYVWNSLETFDQCYIGAWNN